MSAFIVSENHIHALIEAGCSRRYTRGHVLRWYVSGDPARPRELRWENADEIGRMLWEENVKSVAHRYPNDTPDTLPGPVPAADPEAYRWKRPRPRALEPVEALKAIACYEYQSSEHPEWEASEARAFCEALRHAAIAALEGYEDAEWSL